MFKENAKILSEKKNEEEKVGEEGEEKGRERIWRRRRRRGRGRRWRSRRRNA